MTPTYPDDSIQSLVSPWWVRGSPQLARGSLVWALATYPEQKPFRLVTVDRGEDARQHTQATYYLEEFRLGMSRQRSTLPIAALPFRSGEEYIARRGKRRPCLILVDAGEPVAAALARGKRRWQTGLTRLVVPFYSANGTASRGGWPPEFVARIRRGEYSQYFWDNLPLPGSGAGSILRFDHTFAIGHDPANYQQTGYQLHPEALGILDEWFAWYMTGVKSETIELLRDL